MLEVILTLSTAKLRMVERIDRKSLGLGEYGRRASTVLVLEAFLYILLYEKKNETSSSLVLPFF